MKKSATALPLLNVDEKNFSIDGDTISSEDIALDLDATARSAVDGRVFWDGDRLIHLGKRDIDCELFLSNLDPETKNSFKQGLLTFIDSRRFSTSVVMDLISTFCVSSKNCPPNVFDVNWASHALNNRSMRPRKYSARIFLEYWRARFPTAVTDDALNFLAQAAAPQTTSNNVESDDPTKSWLTDEEYDDALRSTWDNYDLTGSTQPALIRLLSLQYARRPSQLSGLKFEDLKPANNKAPVKQSDNEIHFPGAKEQGLDTEFRGGKFEAHPIADHLWNMLKIQRKEITFVFEQVFGLTLSAKDIDQLPIFTTQLRIIRSAKILKDTLGLEPSKHLHDELFHLAPTRLGRVISLTYNMSIGGPFPRKKALPERPISRRTGGPLLLNAIRLRHTRVRQLARQGVPKPVLSYWLGHNNDDALNSYHNDPAETARELDEKMSTGLVTIAQAFHGKIIATDAESTHPNDPLKRLEFAKDDKLNYVGRCGKLSFCATTSIPIPCYRCRSFEPLADAPHDEVLEALRYRQAQEQAIIRPGSMRNLLIPIDLSDDIRAVERCIELCKIKREQQ
ncbi:site-specific integrase [Pseudomonas sp. B21-053]|jgi:hypothetical protein|uniref:site-specific integrase n=1 Tax=Pseudomonas sp. B21-053 TaxID=2895493 RepID=UPI00222E29B3|nr:site-specific integrase [Pseudomonas sp. B21-053]UZE14567.1 site-specific integrase [Pseudomonas sp. B21-053]